jgi:hypothetical protein
MKVVVNRCYGGFGLSDDALGWLRERGWKHCDHPEAAPRHDPLLVACVEAFGQWASGQYASLSIEDAGSAYKIREHDGFEHVESAGFDAVTITDAEVDERIAQAVAAERAAVQAALPVLRWREMRTGRHLGNLGDWRVDAYDSEVILFYRGVDVGGDRANSLDESKSKGVAMLRSAHVAFVVDAEVSR